MEIKDLFFEIFAKYTTDRSVIEGYWKGVEVAYTAPKRYYHTLHHLQALVLELLPYKLLLEDWDAIAFAIIYHDVVYKATNTDNEAQSAELAHKVLSTLEVPVHTLLKCTEIILAAKSHEASEDFAVNIFLDADLSILGKDWDIYKEYAQNVREEYSIYPDFMYNPGRKKALKHFLDMPFIYKTEAFRTTYELKAKENIQREIDLLNQ